MFYFQLVCDTKTRQSPDTLKFGRHVKWKLLMTVHFLQVICCRVSPQFEIKVIKKAVQTEGANNIQLEKLKKQLSSTCAQQ